jgi:hypothetical protein
MKHLLMIAILASFFSASAFGEGQSNTECPMISQARENSKLAKLAKLSKKSNQSNLKKGTAI